MKSHHLAAAALAAISGIAIGQSSGSDTATPAVPNDGAPSNAFTTPAVPGDPATRLPPNVPATPSPPSTPVDVAPVNRDMDKARQDCNALADASARKDCLMHNSAGSSPAGPGMPGRNSAGTGSPGGEAGESKGGATPAAGSSKPSDGSGKSY